MLEFKSIPLLAGLQVTLEESARRHEQDVPSGPSQITGSKRFSSQGWPRTSLSNEALERADHRLTPSAPRIRPTRSRPTKSQVMPGVLDGDERRGGGDESESGTHFLQRTEGITGAVHKKRRRAQLRKVGRAQLGGLAGWVKRVGKQQQARDEPWITSGEHTRLSAAVGVPGQEHSLKRAESGEGLNGFPQTFTVPR